MRICDVVRDTAPRSTRAWRVRLAALVRAILEGADVVVVRVKVEYKAVRRHLMISRHLKSDEAKQPERSAAAWHSSLLTARKGLPGSGAACGAQRER